jgi:hypothetical protein
VATPFRGDTVFQNPLTSSVPESSENSSSLAVHPVNAFSAMNLTLLKARLAAFVYELKEIDSHFPGMAGRQWDKYSLIAEDATLFKDAVQYNAWIRNVATAPVPTLTAADIVQANIFTTAVVKNATAKVKQTINAFNYAVNHN